MGGDLCFLSHVGKLSCGKHVPVLKEVFNQLIQTSKLNRISMYEELHTSNLVNFSEHRLLLLRFLCRTSSTAKYVMTPIIARIKIQVKIKQNVVLFLPWIEKQADFMKNISSVKVDKDIKTKRANIGGKVWLKKEI